jgi:hypothetical protein
LRDRHDAEAESIPEPPPQTFQLARHPLWAREG